MKEKMEEKVEEINVGQRFDSFAYSDELTSPPNPTTPLKTSRRRTPGGPVWRSEGREVR